jgi:hypothetical protein
MEEIREMTEQGFRCFPTSIHPVPDFIAILEDKVYAVEVEHGCPKYAKYSIQHGYDDIIWIRKPKSRSA